MAGWFASPDPQVRAWHLSGPAQGSTYHITYYAADSAVTTRNIDSLLNMIDNSLSLYRDSSLISRFNRSQKGIVPDRHLFLVVKKALEIARETDGTFDPTIFPLVQLWGFGPAKTQDLPSDQSVQQARKNVGWNKLRLQKNFLAKTAPGVCLDLNGIAQGYTVDVLADYFHSISVQDFVVEVGGELRVSGKKRPAGEPFRVGIEAPDEDPFSPTVLQKIIYPGNGAVTTSGNYRKFRQSGSRKVSHLIDARTGYPVDNELLSVTVWAPDAITADGYDNTLMGMGLKKALNFCERKQHLEAFFIYKNADGSVADTATRGFYAMIRNTQP
ncbi:MAG: FAD:protein FMN transferase [Mucilaginibacter polytrichastri]|nr:FAD:protein FMN transferase [Mucilaginibacter polytrichastri]